MLVEGEKGSREEKVNFFCVLIVEHFVKYLIHIILIPLITLQRFHSVFSIHKKLKPRVAKYLVYHYKE